MLSQIMICVMPYTLVDPLLPKTRYFPWFWPVWPYLASFRPVSGRPGARPGPARPGPPARARPGPPRPGAGFSPGRPPGPGGPPGAPAARFWLDFGQNPAKNGHFGLILAPRDPPGPPQKWPKMAIFAHFWPNFLWFCQVLAKMAKIGPVLY